MGERMKPQIRKFIVCCVAALSMTIVPLFAALPASGSILITGSGTAVFVSSFLPITSDLCTLCSLDLWILFRKAGGGRQVRVFSKYPPKAGRYPA